MARSMYQTLIRTSQRCLRSPRPSRLITLRAQSNQSQRVDPNLVDPSDTEPRVDGLAVQRIEEAIHRIIARRSAPDWLPFVPGSSYWVPPRRKTYGIADLVDKLTNTLTEEEVMSLTTARGWPSSAFFFTDASPDPADAETSRNTSLSKEVDG